MHAEAQVGLKHGVMDARPCGSSHLKALGFLEDSPSPALVQALDHFP